MSRRRCASPDRAIAARHAAARLLREARRAVADDVAEAVDWAFSQLPDSLGARRLKIQQLVDQGDLESASVLVAQGLLQRPTDASLTLWRARILYRQEQFEQCARELRLVLARRPHHFATLGLAGLAAHRLNAPVRAASFFARAEARRPGDVPTCQSLVEAWIEAGRLDKAGRVLTRITSPPARLLAKYLRAQGRLLEAAEALETALGRGRGDEDEAVLCDLITILEESGNMARLRRVLERIDVRQPAALARAGLAWLWLGEFHTAAVRTARLVRVPGSRPMGLLVLLVASALLQRPTLVERALGRLRRSDDAIDPDVVADAWCRGLMGRLLQAQCNPRQAGADPHAGQLGSLLRAADRVFEQQLATATGLSTAHRRELKQCQAVCQEGLQLTVAASPKPPAGAGRAVHSRQAPAVAA